MKCVFLKVNLDNLPLCVCGAKAEELRRSLRVDSRTLGTERGTEKTVEREEISKINYACMKISWCHSLFCIPKNT